MVEAISECLREALAKVEIDFAIARADLVEAKIDLALEKGRREVKIVKAKEELAKVKKEAEEVVDKYKASKDFMVEKAQVVVVFQTLEEFYNDHLAFNQEAFKKGYELGGFDYCTQIAV